MVFCLLCLFCWFGLVCFVLVWIGLLFCSLRLGLVYSLDCSLSGLLNVLGYFSCCLWFTGCLIWFIVWFVGLVASLLVGLLICARSVLVCCLV